jgi:hypothetical protein
MLCCLEVVEGKVATKFCALFLMFWEGRTGGDTVLMAPVLFEDVVRFCNLLNAELYCIFRACLGYFGVFRLRAVFTDSVGQGCA